MRKTNRFKIAFASLCMAAGCCAAVFAATQEPIREMMFGPYTIQTVTWDLPDPGFAWTPVSTATLSYHWDWLPHENWPATGTPPSSEFTKSQNAVLGSGQDGSAYLGSYGINQVGQTFYWASVEVAVIIEDIETGQQYVCQAYSGDSTDAFNNCMQHTIYEADWVIYPY